MFRSCLGQSSSLQHTESTLFVPESFPKHSHLLVCSARTKAIGYSRIFVRTIVNFDGMKSWDAHINDGAGVAGAVLQTPSSIINQISQLVILLFQIFRKFSLPNLKSYEAEILREGYLKSLVICVMCHVSLEGLFLTGATPSSLITFVISRLMPDIIGRTHVEVDNLFI